MSVGKWQITDGQVHVWAAATAERPWREDAHIPTQRAEPLGTDELRREMDRVGVDRTVLVPPMWEGPRNDLALAASEREPHRFAVMGRLDASVPWSVEALAEWLSPAGMLGARLAFNRGDKAAQLQRAVDLGFFEAAEANRMPLMLFVPELLPQVSAIARRYPALPIIIDHLALDESDRGSDLHALLRPLHDLAANPNIAVKASALPCFVNDPPAFDTLRPLVREMVGSFGAERVFWGSDLSRLPCDYGDLLGFFVEDFPELDDRQRALILGEGISRWLGWPQAAGTAA